MENQGVSQLLFSAIKLGVAIPSTTLKRLGLNIPFDWEKLNHFAATNPIEITHDEEGRPLPKLPRARVRYFPESDEELRLGK